METSAFNGANLDKAFEMLINQVYNKCHDEIESNNDDLDDIKYEENIDLTKANKPEKKRCCQKN